MLAKKLPFRFTELHGALVLLIFHTVGIIGISSSYSRYFLALTPFHLILSCTILLLFQPSWNKKFLVFALVTYLTGMLVEWIGVHTGILFGDYAYGATLGTKFDGIPYLIGINWLMLTMICGDLARKIKLAKSFQVLLGAALMTGLDFIIEPVAVRYDFWHWTQGIIPLSNYLSWFLIAIPLQGLFHWAKSGNNQLAKWLFLSQLLFFIALNLK